MEMGKKNGRSRLAIYSAMLLGATSIGIGVTLSVPQPAAAYLTLQHVELQRRAGDTYESFLARGKAIASTAVQRQFESELLVSEVSITVLGKNNGSQAAVLRLRVKRSDWQRYPDSDAWTTVFTTAKQLLGFTEPNETSNPPTPPPDPPPETPTDLPDEEFPLPDDVFPTP